MIAKPFDLRRRRLYLQYEFNQLANNATSIDRLSELDSVISSFIKLLENIAIFEKQTLLLFPNKINFICRKRTFPTDFNHEQRDSNIFFLESEEKESVTKVQNGNRTFNKSRRRNYFFEAMASMLQKCTTISARPPFFSICCCYSQNTWCIFIVGKSNFEYRKTMRV